VADRSVDGPTQSPTVIYRTALRMPIMPKASRPTVIVHNRTLRPLEFARRPRQLPVAREADDERERDGEDDDVEDHRVDHDADEILGPRAR